jgi:hypothetical protein
MTPRIKLLPYRQEGKVNGAWVYEIILVTSEQERRLGFASKTAEGLWSCVFSHPSSSEVIKRRTPTLRTVRCSVSIAIGI